MYADALGQGLAGRELIGPGEVKGKEQFISNPTSRPGAAGVGRGQTHFARL